MNPRQAAKLAAETFAAMDLPPNPNAARFLAADLVRVDLPRSDYRGMQRWFRAVGEAIRHAPQPRKETP